MLDHHNIQILGLESTGHVKKLDTLFFLNISKNNYPSHLLIS